MLRIGRILIARGRDAADIPLVNSFGPHVLKSSECVPRGEFRGDGMIASACSTPAQRWAARFRVWVACACFRTCSADVAIQPVDEVAID
jgi:hypothetical protein